MDDAQNLAHDLFMQLGISREYDILFLNGRIDKSSIMMMFVIIFIIDTNAFLKNEFYPFSPMRWRKCTNSEEAQGAPGANSCIPQKYW